MTSISVAEARVRSGRVLAIEPDPSLRRRLKAVLETGFRESAPVVESAAAAIRAIERQLPDLVLTSSLLGPAEVETLTAHLKARPGAAHVPVLITPHLEGAQAAPSSSRRFLWRRRRSMPLANPCDPDTFLQQLDEYLDHSREVRAALGRVVPVIIEPVSSGFERSETRLVQSRSHVLTMRAGASGSAMTPNPADRRRAPRTRQDQLPWLAMSRLPWGSEIKVVDVSRSGVLIETTSRMTPGTLVDLEFLGKDLTTTVPSRILRTTVADADRLGVRYRVAAAFTRDLDLIETLGGSDERLLKPKEVGEILTRTFADIEWGCSPAAIRGRFEREVQRLVPVCSVRIQQSPTRGARGDDSIYFTIPWASGPAVLQATFDRTRPPSAMEFKVLKSSAYLAAVLLDFAPFEREFGLRALA